MIFFTNTSAYNESLEEENSVDEAMLDELDDDGDGESDATEPAEDTTPDGDENIESESDDVSDIVEPEKDADEVENDSYDDDDDM